MARYAPWSRNEDVVNTGNVDLIESVVSPDDTEVSGVGTAVTVSIVTGGLVGTLMGALVSAPKALAAKKAEVKA